MKTIKASILLFYRFRSILWQTTKNDMRARYAGSALGLLWLMVYPLFFLGAYAAVYLYVFNVRFKMFDSNEYVALIFCGLIPFLGFAETLGNGVGSVVANTNLIKNTLFPIELIPAKSVLVSQGTQVTGLCLLIVAIALLGKLTPWVLLVPLLWLLQIIFSIGLIWILSSINVFVRDLQNIVSILILFLMMISPIAYPADMIPVSLKPFLSVNPLYYLITCYQDVLIMGQFPRGNSFWVLCVFSFLTFFIGFWFFEKMKKVFVDNV